MKESFTQQNSTHILYDNASGFDPMWFDPQALEQNRMVVGATQTGRMPALFFNSGGHEYVLKQYHRGGLFQHITERKYLYTSKNHTRSFCEWRILAALHQKEFSVPRPVAACYVRSGIFYTASLITVSCRPAMPLAELLIDKEIPKSLWIELGQLLQGLHQEGVFPPDLNAGNILFDDRANRFWFIDFDRTFRKTPTVLTRRINLARLRRSFEKISKHHQPFHYTTNHFDALLQGYAA